MHRQQAKDQKVHHLPENLRVLLSRKRGKQDGIIIAEGYKGTRQLKPSLSNRSQRNRGYCTELEKGCCVQSTERYDVGDSCNTYPTCARGVRPRDAYGKGEAYAGFTDQILRPGPATRTVNATNALVSLLVITSKR